METSKPGENQDPVFSKETPVVQLVSVQRVGTLICSRDGGIDNPALDLSEPPSPLLKRHTPFHQKNKQKLKPLIEIECSPSEKGNSLPGPKEFNRSWENIEEYLREQSEDTHPEVPSRKKKPFYRRQWFSCTLFVFVLLLLLGAILGIGYYRAVVVPSTLIWGQISDYNPYPIPYDQYDSPVEHSLYQDEDSTDEYTTNTTDGHSTMFHGDKTIDDNSTMTHGKNFTDFMVHKDELTLSVGKKFDLVQIGPGSPQINTEMMTNSIVDPFSATTDRTLQEITKPGETETRTKGENNTAVLNFIISELHGSTTEIPADPVLGFLENDTTTFLNGSLLVENRHNSTAEETLLQDDVVVFESNQTTDVRMMSSLDDTPLDNGSLLVENRRNSTAEDTLLQDGVVVFESNQTTDVRMMSSLNGAPLLQFDMPNETQNALVVQNNTFLIESKVLLNESAEVQNLTNVISNTTDFQPNEAIESQDVMSDSFLNLTMQMHPNETKFPNSTSVLYLNETSLVQLDDITESQSSATNLFQFNTALNETDNMQNSSTSLSNEFWSKSDQQASSAMAGLNISGTPATMSPEQQQEEVNRWLYLLSIPGPLQFQNRFPGSTNVVD